MSAGVPWRPISGSFVCWLLAAGLAAVAGHDPRIVVLTPQDPAADLRLLRTTLAPHGYVLGDPEWSGARVEVRIADVPPGGRGDLFAALGALRALRDDVVAAGELLDLHGGRVTFLTGRVLVRFVAGTSESDARRWGAVPGLVYLEPARGEPDAFLFEARLRPAELLSLERRAALFGGIQEIRSLVSHVTDPSTLNRLPPGGYHRIPRRDRVVLILERGTVLDSGHLTFTGNNISLIETGEPRVKIAQFDSGPQDMKNGIVDLRAHQGIEQAGALLTTAPLTFLTDQLVVRFVDHNAYYQAGAVLAAYGLQEIRALPYVKNGYIYRYPQPIYEIYDAAHALMLQGLVTWAIPNIVTVNQDDDKHGCGDKSCTAASYHEYLREMHMCDVWTAEGSLKTLAVDEVVLGVLDGGIHSNIGSSDCATVTNSLYCNQLRVGHVVDFETMRTCETGDPKDWCSAGCANVWTNCTGAEPCKNADCWTATHGNEMALTAAALPSGDLRGIAPGVILLNAKRRPLAGLMSEVQLADALWWMAGGDPGWAWDDTNYICPDGDAGDDSAGCSQGDLPAQLAGPEAADVINLSFSREDFVVPCPDESPFCEIVCTELPDCSIVGSALARIRSPGATDGIREGGALVVNSVGITSTLGDRTPTSLCYQGDVDTDAAEVGMTRNPHTDLAVLPSTVAVGSVHARDSMLPYENLGAGDCLIHHPGDFVDLVAPMGGTTILCRNCTDLAAGLGTGESSAGAAAVSGVAATMLWFNPSLSASQMHCILKTTARKNLWESVVFATWDDLTCAFSGDHSKCMGYGMVDACAAVAAAVACREDGDSGDCPCPADQAGGDDKGQQKIQKDDPRQCLVGEFVARPDGLRIPADLLDYIRCMLDRECACAMDPDQPDCLFLELLNPYGEDLYDVEAQLCMGPRCWDLPWTATKWLSKETVRIPVEARAEMLAPLRLGVTGADLKFLCGGGSCEATQKQCAP